MATNLAHSPALAPVTAATSTHATQRVTTHVENHQTQSARESALDASLQGRRETMASLTVSPEAMLAAEGPPAAEAREVLRCDHCSLVQFRTANSLCRRCHKDIQVEPPAPAQPNSPRLVPAADPALTEGIQVARTVREMRRSRNLSQRQLAGRMAVPRTYISKIENGKAMPTLSSLQRLATALEIDICDLLQDHHSRRQIEADAILADPFLAELAPYIAKLDNLQRQLVLSQVKQAAQPQRRSA